MQRGCICYVIDQNYLFPTLLSASQAREHTPSEIADVIIICLSQACTAVDVAKSVADELGIELVRRDLEDIGNLHPMFGRLFIADLLPRRYVRVVYVDGDTQITGSLKPLLEAQFDPGHFLAVRDPGGLFAKLSPKWRRRTLDDRVNAGLTSIDDYFNTGVLVFDLDDWRQLAAATLDLIHSRKDAFKFGDQDPMNLAIGEKCIYIPNRWNFPGFLINTEAEHLSKPIIYHFMSNPRPWLYAGRPWGRKWSQPYLEFQARFKALQTLTPRTTLAKALKYHVQQSLKNACEYRPVSKMQEIRPNLPI